MTSIAPPKPIAKLVSSAPLLLAVAAIVSSMAQWKGSIGADTKKMSNDIENVERQVKEISNAQIEMNKNIANMQIQLNEEQSRRKVVAQLEYSAAVIEARSIEQKFGKAVADKYLLNKQKIRDEIVKARDL